MDSMQAHFGGINEGGSLGLGSPGAGSQGWAPGVGPWPWETHQGQQGSQCVRSLGLVPSALAPSSTKIL